MLAKWIHKTYDSGRIVIWLFLAQYLAILLIPLVSMFIIYHSTVRTVTDELAENNFMLLDKGKNAVEQDLSRMDMAFQQIENDPTVLNFKNVAEPYKGSGVIRVKSLQRVLENYRLCDSLIYDYYLLYDGNQAVISPYASATLDTFYNTCFSYPAMTRDVWQKQWTTTYRSRYMTFLPAARISHFNQTGSMVTVIKPVRYFNQYEGITVVMLLNNSQLQKQLRSIYTEEQLRSAAFIVDDSGRILTCTADGPTEQAYAPSVLKNAESFGEGRGNRQVPVNGQTMLLTYTAKDEYGWRYVSVQPLDSAFARASYIKNIITVLMAVDLAASLFIIGFLVRINGRPAQELLMMAMQSQQETGEKSLKIFDVIQSAFSNLTHQYDSVSRKLQWQSSYLRTAFFDRLFGVGFRTEEEMISLMANAGLDLRAAWYTVVLLCINGYEDIMSDEEFDQLNQKMLSLETGLSCLPDTDEDLYFHRIENNQLTLLIPGNGGTQEERREEIRRALRPVQDVIKRSEGADVSLYVGSSCDGLMKVPLSAESAAQCMLFDRTKGGSGDIVWYEDIGGAFTGYYYPRVMESRLVSGILSGNERESLAVIDEIYEENHTVRRLPIGMLRLLMYELYGTMLRVMDSGSGGKNSDFIRRLYAEMEEIGQHRHGDTLIARVKETYAYGCSLTAQNKQDSGLVGNVVRYLKQHYREADLTLTTLTENFEISQAYLSRQFKDSTGFTVYEYLEKMRIQEACRLLSEGSASVKKIAEEVGYVSSNTFCRAFKRITGVRASDYRRMERSV